MAVRMRLRRMGRKKKPFYRVVVAEAKFARDGRFIESVGYYNPMVHPAEVNLQEDRILYWLSNGVQPSKTVKNILQNEGIWLKWDLTHKKVAPEVIDEEMKKWSDAQELKKKRQELVKAQQTSKKEEKKIEKKAEAPVAAPAEAPVKEAPVENTADEDVPAAEPEVTEAESENTDA